MGITPIASPVKMKANNTTQLNYKSISCYSCGSLDVKKNGARKTKNRGTIQRYICNSCKKRFTQKDAFFRMRNSPYKITQCMDMYFRGVSLRKIQEHLQAFTPHNSSHQSILNWIRKYCIMIGKFTDELRLKTGTQLTFDEVEFKTKGKQSFFFDIMDMDTRYILASDYFYRRGENELLAVLKQAERKAITKPTDIYTDGLRAYPAVIRKAYYSCRLNYQIQQHITKSSDKKFNWKIERLQENIRERTKVIRQFKSMNSAKAIMKGWEIFYNFCRKHQGIKCYPYELAIPELKDKLGINKWLGLIELSFN